MGSEETIILKIHQQLYIKGYIKMEMIEFLKHCDKVYMKEYIKAYDLNYCDGLNHNYIFLFPDPPIDYEYELRREPRMDREDVQNRAVFQFLDQIIRKEFMLGLL